MQEKILLDPSFRRLDVIFTPEDLARVYAAGEVIWGRNEPFPEADYDSIREEVGVIITGHWRHGDVSRWPKLRAVMEVGGGFPSPQSLDYAWCFSHNVRVLSCAPAFGPQVAEMALGLTLASRGLTQVSTNVTQPDRCSARQVFDFVGQRAAGEGVEIVESELIGVVSRAHLPPEDVAVMRFSALRETQFIEHWTGKH